MLFDLSKLRLELVFELGAEFGVELALEPGGVRSRSGYGMSFSGEVGRLLPFSNLGISVISISISAGSAAMLKVSSVKEISCATSGGSEALAAIYL